MALYELDKRLYPGFYDPSRLPLTGSYEIDWSNPLTAYLKNAIIAISKTEAYDFVTNARHVSTSASSAGSKYPDGVYINNDGNLGTFSHVIEKGCFVVDATCTTTYSAGASRYLLDWAGSGEVVRLEYNGFSSGRNYQFTTRGGFGTTIQALAAPKVTSDAELQRARVIVAGWDLDVGSSLNVAPDKAYTGTGGASTNDTNERSITICSSGWIGVFRSLFVFSEDLPASIKVDLSRNPYQLLKPKVQPVYFTAAGAPPASNDIPVFLQHFRNQGQV